MNCSLTGADRSSLRPAFWCRPEVPLHWSAPRRQPGGRRAPRGGSAQCACGRQTFRYFCMRYIARLWGIGVAQQTHPCLAGCLLQSGWEQRRRKKAKKDYLAGGGAKSSDWNGPPGPGCTPQDSGLAVQQTISARLAQDRVQKGTYGCLARSPGRERGKPNSGPWIRTRGCSWPFPIETRSAGSSPTRRPCWPARLNGWWSPVVVRTGVPSLGNVAMHLQLLGWVMLSLSSYEKEGNSRKKSRKN